MIKYIWTFANIETSPGSSDNCPTTSIETRPPQTPDSSPLPCKFKGINAMTYDTSKHPLPHALLTRMTNKLSFEPQSSTRASKPSI